ncbi:MAG: osmotically inducible protein OsmC [Cytophagales bacterium CG18_big_fil_WC_8_21_14_2_50_42_9]|nr:MAG: osmotically inducible protein OsmC [Cytophagales bacterium CG18_big_fil_WC_8_21_14_2_50_42_9]
MSTITSIYSGQLRTQATHLASNNSIVTDAPLDNNGRGEAFSPTDLVCAALGSCMMTIMGIVAQRHGLQLEDTRIHITKIMAADPRRIAEIILHFTFPANNFSEKERALLENAARTCPVALSLHPDVKQTVTFQYT